MEKTKYRVMAKVQKKHNCCGDKWMNIDTTYDPIAYRAEHPNWIIKFERVILGKIEVFGIK